MIFAAITFSTKFEQLMKIFFDKRIFWIYLFLNEIEILKNLPCNSEELVVSFYQFSNSYIQ